jgi:hypothetical protein
VTGYWTYVFLVKTTCVAFGVATCSVHLYRSVSRSSPEKRFSPEPSRIGAIAMCISSTRRAQVLLNGRYATTEPGVLSIGCLARLLKCCLDSLGDEVEDRAAFHRDRGSCVMRQHKNWTMVWGLVAPPTVPAIILPLPADRTEHVAAHNPSANILKAPRGYIVVGANCTFRISENNLLDGPRSERPLVQPNSANAEWVLTVLLRASTIAIDGDGEAANYKPALC